jgi:hypothetical protein
MVHILILQKGKWYLELNNLTKSHSQSLVDFIIMSFLNFIRNAPRIYKSGRASRSGFCICLSFYLVSPWVVSIIRANFQFLITPEVMLLNRLLVSLHLALSLFIILFALFFHVMNFCSSFKTQSKCASWKPFWKLTGTVICFLGSLLLWVFSSLHCNFV